MREAESCDLLLFRGSHATSGIVRGVTRGHFDHVGIIIRTVNDGPLDFSIVEAVGKLGVTSHSWSKIRSDIGVGNFYEKVAFRKLKGPRPRDFI